VAEDAVEVLLNALKLSPDNVPLRYQVVRALLDKSRWKDVETHAPRLLSTEHRPFALFALARAAFGIGDAVKAGELYRQAITLDRNLIDEGFELMLEPENAIPVRAEGFEEEKGSIAKDRRRRITFEDVGGMEELKEQVRLNIIYPFQHPEVYTAYGKKIGGGILMYGPPGCGKTYLARATAGEIGAHFYSVSLDEVLSMWLGQSEKHLSEIFDTARSNVPAVIFIDEIDALGAKRSQLHSASTRTVVSHFLSEMDGIGDRNEQILVLGATNTPWNVEPALRRPGRFDRVLFVSPPDGPAREAILRLHCSGRRMDPSISHALLAEKAANYSGADLAALVDRASEIPLKEAIRTGRMRDVTMSDFLRALNEFRPTTTTEWLRRAKNYVTYANQDGLYDDLARYLKSIRLL
jgi:ATP-dependent 26S proteasome regulatory subunit